MNWRLDAMPWLPAAPKDFRERLRALEQREAGAGGEARSLATHSLDLNRQTAMAKALRRLSTRQALVPLSPFKLGVLGSGTLDLVHPVLVTSAARHGIDLSVIGTPFDQHVQAAIDPESELHRSEPDAVLVALHHTSLGLTHEPADARESEARIDRALELVTTILHGLHDSSDAQVIVQTVPRPSLPALGSADFVQPGTSRWTMDRFNATLREALAAEDLVLDVAGLAESVGLDSWHDVRGWHWGKLQFATSMLPLYGDYVGRLLGALRGKSRRVLVLDLDNTLWGGVVGDDGVDGLKIGEGDPVGEAFLGIQRVALELRARGVLLAVSSKNTDAVARQPFRDHPEMLLKEEHFAVFQANWEDKATNLEAIAEALSLGLDSFVVLDDNPAERTLVRQALPEVAVPELPDDPSLIPSALLWSGYFDTARLTEADCERVRQYSDNARRLELHRGSRDLDSYLQSLEMVIDFEPFSSGGSARIAQLVNRSNQFNLTTHRHGEPEIIAMADDPELVTMQVRLTDAFGDNGMIAVVIARPAGEILEIDTWLMSCRVLGRRVEQAVLNELVSQAKARGHRSLLGTYVPSGRNDIVRDHYAKLGFAQAPPTADGATTWRLELDDYRPFDAPIQRKAADRKS